jgi:predicted small secreted protein
MMPAMAATATHRRWGAAAVVAVALLLAGCETGQDPGLDTGPGADAPATTSDTLPDCPPGGPDATTPDAGCIDGDGAVVRP